MRWRTRQLLIQRFPPGLQYRYKDAALALQAHELHEEEAEERIFQVPIPTVLLPGERQSIFHLRIHEERVLSLSLSL